MAPLTLKAYMDFPSWNSDNMILIETSEHSYQVKISGRDRSSGQMLTIAVFDWRSMDSPLHEAFEYRGQRHSVAVRIQSGMLWGHWIKCTIDNEDVRMISVDQAANEEFFRDAYKQIKRRLNR